MLHGSAKIASLSSEMSLLEKAPTSIFDKDQRPITERQLLACHHFAQVCLWCSDTISSQSSKKLYIVLTNKREKKKRRREKKVHRIHFPFLGIFIPLMKWLQIACASLTRWAVLLHCPIPVQHPFQSHLRSPFSVFYISRHSGKLGDEDSLVDMQRKWDGCLALPGEANNCICKWDGKDQMEHAHPSDYSVSALWMQILQSLAQSWHTFKDKDIPH